MTKRIFSLVTFPADQYEVAALEKNAKDFDLPFEIYIRMVIFSSVMPRPIIKRAANQNEPAVTKRKLGIKW